jgi:hypothetical protein
MVAHTCNPSYSKVCYAGGFEDEEEPSHKQKNARNWKKQGNRFSFRINPDETQSHYHLDFSSMKFISDSRSPVR